MACELLPCGHCKSLEEDDQCGLPEHRYCAYCVNLKEVRSTGKAYMGLFSAINAALKDPENAIKILRKAMFLPDDPNPNSTKEKP